MKKIVRIQKDKVVFVAIDFQEKLLPAMADSEEIQKNIIKLASGLKVFEIPHIVTTQYAKGLGNTIDAVAEAIGEFEAIDKTTFSAYKNEEFCDAIKKSGKDIVILSGIETHICVEQTALDLIEAGYDVVLAADCVGSRDERNHGISLRRLQDAGVTLSSCESILYEILGGAKASEFKAISSIVK